MLLGVIVAILLARLSDTDFIIRTTVNDFWGAIAVGFIGTASGPTILQKFTNALRSSRSAEKRQREEEPAKVGSKLKRRAESAPAAVWTGSDGDHA
jgi:hypothetical protein